MSVFHLVHDVDCTFQATNNVITRCPKSTPQEMQAAVDSCKEAFKTWKNTTPLTRQQIMFKYQSLIKQNMVAIKQAGNIA